MNGIQYGNAFHKLELAGDLRKATQQSDNLTDAVGRALQTIHQAIAAAPADASLQQMLNMFLRALATYNSAIDANPAAAARQFGREIDRIIRDRGLGMAVKSSLQKAMSAHKFWNR
jgi:hypothetical protein